MAWSKLFVSAVLAGVMISISGTVYLSCLGREQPVIGAVLFSVGLFAVCIYGLALYTGWIGYALEHPPHYLGELALVWLGNLTGTFAAGIAVRIALPKVADTAGVLLGAKLAQHPVQTLLLGVFCGVLVHIAVDNFKRNSGGAKYLGILLCIPVFVLSGFEHCAADMFYASAGGVSAQLGSSLTFVLLVTLGNSLGCLLLPAAKAVHGGG